MITDQRLPAGGSLPTLGLLVEKADHLVQTIASPSIVQLVLRVALAVPFWRSGILKWAGFLRLNDTAVTLFTDEFMLHLPGGPYHYPAPTVMAFLSGCGEITFPILLVLGSRHALRSARTVVHDGDRRAHRARWLADPYHLGGNGARHHGLRAGTRLARPSDRPGAWPRPRRSAELRLLRLIAPAVLVRRDPPGSPHCWRAKA